MHQILHLLTIDAPVETVYQAIAEQQGLAAWWTHDVVAKPVIGSIAEFDFGERYHNEMVITVLEENKRVAWRCIQGNDEWIDTTFSFELEEIPAGTRLRFTHANWRDMTDFYASCNYNWGYYLASLKRLCETGIGSPFPASMKEARDV